jgi:uncharacterized phage-associated protein
MYRKQSSKSLRKPISNLKLQKLLYYVQGWTPGLYGNPAFYERVEAWVHGPVVPAAFYEYRHFGWNPIDVPAEPVSLSEQEKSHISNVLDIYGKFSATQLESFSHEEDPWIEARRGLDATAISRNVITQDAMKAYFSRIADA